MMETPMLYTMGTNSKYILNFRQKAFSAEKPCQLPDQRINFTYHNTTARSKTYNFPQGFPPLSNLQGNRGDLRPQKFSPPTFYRKQGTGGFVGHQTHCRSGLMALVSHPLYLHSALPILYTPCHVLQKFMLTRHLLVINDITGTHVYLDVRSRTSFIVNEIVHQ